jgi:exodeoxyribonuclease V beta subunit
MSQQNNQPVNEISESKPREHQNFDPMTAPLVGANLIEASAGTGKTYSIAILALRLIIEENIPIDKILMVTFTRDAAAEMELRVRNFIREGLQILKIIADGGENFEGLDSQIVEMLKANKDLQETQQRLKFALVQFDKAAIYTIHSFCSKILAEYAFESGQLFHAETIETAVFDQFLHDAFNQAWRDQVTILDEKLLIILLANQFDRKRIFQLVRGAIGGKKIYLGDMQNGETIQQYKDRTISELNNLEDPQGQLDILYREIVDIKSDILSEVSKNRDVWTQEALNHKKKTVKEKIPEILSLINEEELFKEIMEKRERGYFNDFFSTGFISKITAYQQKKLEILELETLQNNYKATNLKLVSQLISILSYLIYKQVEQQLIKIKDYEGQITFDDLIAGLHRVICNDDSLYEQQSARLIKILQDRYSAVFIDEFQDTDQLQFEIFFNVFKNKNAKNQHILFFIGDPKQSIYAFRKADLQTYFRAAKLVDDVWRMNTNYRSTANYIQAMNEFFQPTDTEFDAFKSDQMKYYVVDAPTTARTGHLLYNNHPLNPLRIICSTTQYDILNKTAHLVRKLLKEKSFEIKKEGVSERIKANQIGILVRTKYQGKSIRQYLSKFGIAAVTVSDDKIFESSEALDLWYVLQAVFEIKIGSINRALLTKIVGLNWNEISKLDLEKTIQQFRNYQEAWKTTGVYKMLRQFISDTRIINRKLEKKIENADRLLANTFQLMEMLHEAETDNKYSPEELIFWLKKGIDGEKNSEDGYLQRIESDEAAVKIVTMHSCKGLEYDIVIAPFLDIKSADGFKTTQFRSEEGYFTADKDLLKQEHTELATLQKEQENLRLLYVAITRARYHCYVLSTGSNVKKPTNKTALKHFQYELITTSKDITNIKIIGSEDTSEVIKNSKLFEIDPVELEPVPWIMESPLETPVEKFATLPVIQIADQFWQKTSYSRLNPKHEYISVIQSEPGTDTYDKFIFKDLRKGAQTGNMLHDLLERIDFSQSNNWEKIINSSVNRYPGTGVKEEHYEMMQEFLHIVTNTLLPEGNFCLNVVNRGRRLSELEFDMPVQQIDWDLFPTELENNKIPLRINRETPLTGILNGKIDLFFEQDNRYYLLDWKSNHLGGRPEDYNIEALAKSMEEHNYYLQYYFYSLALYRYLKLRKPDFDYAKQFGGVYYLFVRGMRQGTNHGIYFHKPNLNDLLLLEQIFLKQPAIL